MSVDLHDVSHRPWPLPSRPWSVSMRWEDLLFLHWPVRADALAPRIPAPLAVDTFDGWAWVGVVPFRMESVHLRTLPPVPTTSSFPELNVRTYVRAGERAGVWFFSLDAGSRIVVRAARWWFNLPYFDARMRSSREVGAVRYESVRTHAGAPRAEFRARYAPVSEERSTAPGSLEHWLTERYCLFAANRSGRLSTADIHHSKWPLQDAEVEIERNTMAEAAGIALPPEQPLVHFARSLEVVSWAPSTEAPIARER